MNDYSLYIHRNKLNGKVYVGITNNIEKRWRSNGIAYKPYKGKENSRAFWNAIKKYGWPGFTHEVIERGLTFETACAREVEAISELRSTDRNAGYNISKGGNGGVVYLVHPRGMYGKHHTDENKKHQQDFMLDKKNNSMTNGQCIWGVTHPHPRGMAGHTHTEEHNRSISEKTKGKNAKPLIVVCKTGEQRMFESQKVAAAYLGIQTTSSVFQRLIKTESPYKILTHNGCTKDLERLEGVMIRKCC